jgi:hypothetical protein
MVEGPNSRKASLLKQILVAAKYTSGNTSIKLRRECNAQAVFL